MTAEWRSETWRGSASINPPGYFGVTFSPGTVGAPSAGAKLVRCGASLYYHLANTNPSVTITPDWPFMQSGFLILVVQAAGDATVPSVTDGSLQGIKLRAGLVVRPWSFGWSTQHGAVSMQTDGVVWSAGEDRTPPGGGLQIRPCWVMNDGSGLITLFGSNGRWNYDLRVDVLWDV